MRCRREKGEYTDFYDYLRKVDQVACNKKSIESLIKAGAFDSMGHTRKGLLAVHADAIDAFMGVKKNEAVGQFDLFGSMFDDGDASSDPGLVVTPPIPTTEWDKSDLLAFEREMLGLYVSDHPLFGLEHVLNKAADMQIARLNEEGVVSDGSVVTLAGILSGVQRRITKQGKAWASASLEDLTGAVEALFFPNTYELVGQYIAEDAIVVVKGRVDRRDDQPRLMAMDLSIPDISAPDDHKPVVLALPPSRCTPPLVERLKEVLASHPGSAEVHLKLVNGSRSTLLRLGPLRVNATPALMGDLKALLGPGSLAS
jgi:DNA polymerase-3 subunit alpha